MGDLDIVYELAPRWPSIDDYDACMKRSNDAFPPARGFMNYLGGPSRTIIRKLSVSKHVSLHELREIRDDLSWPFKLIEITTPDGPLG